MDGANISESSRVGAFVLKAGNDARPVEVVIGGVTLSHSRLLAVLCTMSNFAHSTLIASFPD